MTLKHFILYIILIACCASCAPTPKDAQQLDVLPPIYPDYVDVTVPKNIAPLNFLVRSECEALYVTASAAGNTLKAKCSGNQAAFDVDKWHALLAEADKVTIEVAYRENGKWFQYQPFDIFVQSTPIDAYLTYRMIEPDYEVFSRLSIEERNLEDFSTRVLCDHNMVGNRCMNCHTFAQNRGDLSFLYVRGEGGGMILNQQGVMRKLGLKTDDMPSGSVYAQFSPSGRYLVFSSNVIIPAFHSDPAKRLEVFDTKSDVYVADLNTNRVIRSPLLADSLRLETFPTFSPDGKYIYYCVSDALKSTADVDSLQYHLCRVSFDEMSGSVGTEADTLVYASAGTKSSVCHPRVSPDGRYLLYTVADYGTFPIWHREADQQMLDLATGEINTMDIVNSDMSDTYHSWCSSGRWMVFASKRDDGLYGKPYICYIDPDGNPAKPFVVPQKSPQYYDNCLVSYNVPELGREPVNFSASDVADAMALDAETFR